jgi:hypothetical protein
LKVTGNSLFSSSCSSLLWLLVQTQNKISWSKTPFRSTTINIGFPDGAVYVRFGALSSDSGDASAWSKRLSDGTGMCSRHSGCGVSGCGVCRGVRSCRSTSGVSSYSSMGASNVECALSYPAVRVDLRRSAALMPYVWIRTGSYPIVVLNIPQQFVDMVNLDVQ